jgi:membrane protein implicated in regulation of membrane protease activity
VGTDWWRDRIVLVLTLLLLGVPVWTYHWFSMQRLVAAGHAEERASSPRRILIFGVVGVGTLAFLGNISYLLFVFLNALLEGTLSLTLLVDAKWSMGAVVAAVLFVPYYWFTLQEDRKAAKESAARPSARRKSVTVLIPEGSGPFLASLEMVLRGKPRVLCRLDPDVGMPELSADDFRSVERRIGEAAGDRVLLVADATGVRVYSYR